jgi:hypothetical protein
MTSSILALGGLVLLPALGCVHEPTPVERAASLARRQCTDPSLSANEIQVLRDTKVVAAEPITFLAGASTRTEGGRTVSGAKLLVSTPPGVTAEQMDRLLRCHSARALLGQVDPALLADDPFYLPDTWVDIDVRGENGLLAVRLSADRIWQNLAVFHRATAFAETHRAASSP